MKYAMLTPLRGVAALWVFAFHFHWSEAFRNAFPTAYALCRVGDLGVPMFFVISGYCLAASAQSALRHRESASSFLWRRLLRIYPPFWFSIVVVVLLPFVMEGLSAVKTGQYDAPRAEQVHFLSFGWGEWLAYASLGQVFAWGSGVNDLQAKFTALNAVYWTLAIELQFYLVVTASLRSGTRFYAMMAAITAVSIPFSLYPDCYITGIFLPYWPMFALGIGLFRYLEANPTNRPIGSKVRGMYISSICLLALLVLFIVSLQLEKSCPPMVFATAFAVVLFCASYWDPFFTRLISANRHGIAWLPCLPIVLGEMSYSLYLLHGRLQFLVGQVARQLCAMDSICFDLLVMGGTCALCYPFYRCCEAPYVRARVS